MTNEALTSSFSRARRLRVSTALPSTVATTARGCTNSGILRDSSAIPPGWRRGRGSRTFQGPRGPFPVRRRPLQAARGAAGAGPGGSQRERGERRSFPQGIPGSIPTPARSCGAEALHGSPEGCWCLFVQPQPGIREGAAAEASLIPVSCAWSPGRGSRTQLRI